MRSTRKRFRGSSKSRSRCCCRVCNEHGTPRCCRLFASNTFEAMLALLLFLILPHAVCGIVSDTQQTASEQKQNDADLKSQAEQPTTSVFDIREPHFQTNRTGIVELFEWKFSDVGKECEQFLGPMGYAGVQLSPVTEHLLFVNNTPSWRTFYQPISFKFATSLGSVEDFMEMSRACNAVGVRVYVDVVLNHMLGGEAVGALANSDRLVGIAGSVANVNDLNYAGVPFTAQDFHKPCPIENYMNSYEVRNCQLNGQPDLDHSKAAVKEQIVTLLNALIDMGVAGFRVDAAKYVWPVDLKTIYAAVGSLNSEEFDFPEDSRPFFYQEIVDLGMESVSKTEYTGYGMVTEYLYAAELSTIFRGKVPLNALINWGPAMGFLPHEDALVFVDTHESQHGYLKRELGQNQLLSYRQRRQHIMATAFMLAHPYGRIKRIMSSYYADESDMESAPPMTLATTINDYGGEEEREMIRSPEFDVTNQQCTAESAWICEHRWPPIVNMLALANNLSPMEDGVINFQTFGPNHIAFCRGRKAFVAFNNDATLDYATTVRTCLESGIYCDVISGGLKADGSDCAGKRIAVNRQGMAELMLPAVVNIDDNNSNRIEDQTSVDVDYGVIAIHIGSKLVNVEADAEVLETEQQDDADFNSKISETTSESDDAGVDSGNGESIKLDKR